MLFEEVLSPMPCEGQYGGRPMTDIVQRLRKRHEMQYQGELRAIPSIFTEAADEIERLRAVWQSDDALFDRVDDGLKQAEDEIERLREALSDLIADWEAVPEDVQVPDEINVNEHWDAARTALKENT
jgi:hypothetical protein